MWMRLHNCLMIILDFSKILIDKDNLNNHKYQLILFNSCKNNLTLLNNQYKPSNYKSNQSKITKINI